MRFQSPRHMLALALLAAAPGFAADAALEATLKRLDQAAAGFKGLKANLRKVAYTKVVDKSDIDSGSIAIRKVKAHDIRIRFDLKDPRQQTVTIGEGKAIVFNPLTNEAQKADLGQYRALADQLMLLGFGSTSTELKGAYDVTFGGSDTVNGVKASRIDLVPRDKELLHQIKKCELWISEDGMTVQQKFYTGGGDYQIATYTNIDTHSTIKDSDTRLDLPKDVKITKLK